MKTPLIISLDIETYGAFKTNHYGLPLPEQTVFHPQRSLYTDKVARHDLIQTVSITVVEGDPSDLSSIYPTKTFVLHMHSRSDQLLLFKWLRAATHILGMNLLFDLSYLLTAFAEARYALAHRPILIDLAILIYLNSELQTERSLKDIGPYLGTHSYSNEPSLREGKRFPSPHSAEAIRYNALDTHNTVLAISALASIIPTSYGPTDKLSSFSTLFYSRTLWSLLRLTLSGIHFNRPRLLRLHNWLLRFTELAAHHASTTHSLTLEGKGSTLSKTCFLESALDEADAYQSGTPSCPPPSTPENTTSTNPPVQTPTERDPGTVGGDASYAPAVATQPTVGPNPPPPPSATTASPVRNHPLLILTEKTHKLSFCNENRQLISNLLPPLSRFREGLSLAYKHARSQKLISSYTYPLLFHRRNHPDDQRSIILPTSLSHPIFYPVPSSFDTAESQFGGTIQGRVTCKLPSAQTFPKLIQRCYSSRFGPLGLLLSMDLAQIELRVAALLSGDPSLMAAFLDPSIDLHTDRAIELLTEATLIAKYGPNFRKVKAFRTLERQAGKAQPLSEPVLTPNGWVPIGDLRVGDEVITVTGESTLVTGIYPQGVKPTFSLTTHDGATTRCCDEHLWTTNEGTLPTSHIRKHLTRGKGWRFEIPTPSPAPGTPTELEVPPYTLGVLLGDGCISCGVPAISGHPNDEEIINHVRQELSGWDLRIYRPSSDLQLTLLAVNRKGRKNFNPLKLALLNLGLWGKTSHTKRIPQHYLSAPIEDRKKLLSGLLDTDGTISSKSSISYSTASEGLAHDLIYLVRSLGGTAKLSIKKQKYYHISIRIPFNPFSLKRKAVRFHPMRMFRKITSITPSAPEECVCISVAHPSHLYITRDFLVTHNTVNFSDLFLSSPHTIQSTINNMLGLLIPIEICKEIVNRRPSSRPGLWAWQQSLLRAAERDGFIVLPFIGQSRYFAGGSAHLNEIVNFPIQTTAGNVLLAIQHELDDLLPRWESPKPPVYMYLNVYDALYFDTKRSYEEELREHIAEAVRRVCLPTGYWGKLCTYTGRNLPLLYEIS